MRQPVAHWLLLILLPALFAAALPSAVSLAQAPGPQARSASWTLSSVADWEAGGGSGLLVTNNGGGELRLAEGQTSGSFISQPFQATFAANAAGAIWEADLVPGTTLRLEMRARATAPAGDPEAGWGPWQPLLSGEVRSEARESRGAYATPDVVALPEASQYLQVRATFSSDVARASAVLEAVTISYLSTTSTPAVFPAGLPRRPILAGPVTRTPRPTLITRTDWSGQNQAAQSERSDPQGVIIHQIDATVTPSTTLDLLRALSAWQVSGLGWEDLGYHYLIDPEGNLFEGRQGGPTSAAQRMAGGGRAVHVALLGPRDAAPTAAAQATMVALLAWLGEAYGIAPTGQHAVGTPPVLRPNLAGHNQVAPEAPDPFPPLLEQLPAIRTQIDQATVRARWYFAEGNTSDYSERFSFFNPTGAAADARVILIRPGVAPIIQNVAVPAGARADLTVNDLVPDAPALAAIVESSAPILAERSMGLTTDIGGGPGISELARVWYFAEGSTTDERRTFLILFNPNPNEVAVTVNYMRRDGVNLTQAVQIAAQSRLVIAVNDITQADGTRPMEGVNFGVQVIASQPIAAERTMRFGPNLTGLQTSPGISSLARRWYFAEGTTENGFRTRLLLLNPNNQPASTEATFLGPNGQQEVRRYAIPPRSQLAIDVNEVVPDLGVSTIIDADRPLAVERTMTFNGGAAGTVSAGATMPRLGWAFVDGRTRDASYYLSVGNPSRLAARVTVDLRFESGATASQSFEVAPGARYTFAVHELYPDEGVVSAMVRGSQPIIAERSLFPGGGVRGGATVLGLPLP